MASLAYEWPPNPCPAFPSSRALLSFTPMNDILAHQDYESPTVVRKIFDFCGYCLYWGWYWTEHLLVLEWEIVRRALRFADPRVHSEERRIRAITEGRQKKPDKKFFVLLLFPRPLLAGFTKSLIAALGQSPFNLVVVLNAPLPAAAKE